MAGLSQAQSADDSGDPPDRVARLSYVQGDVGLLPAGAQDWGEAGLNRPLTNGDKLSSGADARAELELGGAALRLDGQTDLGVLQLDDTLAQLELTQGTLALTVRRLDDGQSYEIDTPTVALVVDHPGSYRVDVAPDGQATEVTAFDGSATVYGENDAQRPVLAGRSYRFTDALLANVRIAEIGPPDAFDAWNDQRDRRYADTDTRGYVSDDVIGYQDLDHYGQWRSDPEYGTVWYPAHVDVDWAPYRDGHWAWVGPWGWTWIDDAPWGFAPYHYGRWAWRHDGWCWVPGPVGWRPVYAPALVAFVGGNHWSASVGERPVGWFPLAPGEVYDPWYRSSRRYYTQVNVTNIHVHNTVIVNRIDQRYGQWRRGLAPPVRALHGDGARGFTAVSARAFADAERVQRHRLQVDPARLADAHLLARGAVPQPTPRSLVAVRPPHARPLPAQGFGREVVARHAPRADTAADRGRANASAGDRNNVRVLRPQGAPLPAVARLLPAGRGDARPGLVRPARARVVGSNVSDLSARSAPRQAPLQAGELPSARFVRGRMRADRVPDQAHPGMNLSANPQAGHDRAAQPASPLPPVPRLIRADDARPPAVQPNAADAPYRRAPDFDAEARAARIEAARQQAMQRQAEMSRGESLRQAEAAHLRAPDFDAEARAARIEAARQQAMQRQAEMSRGEGLRQAAPAHLRAPDVDAQLRARPAPPRFEHVPDFRAMPPMPQAAPAARAPAPRPSTAAAPAPHPRREPPREDRQH